MRALVIGYGSIGQRHVRILSNLVDRVSVVSRRKDIDCLYSYCSLERALNNEKPEYVVISNETSKHEETLQELIRLKYKGIVLVEKPIFHKNISWKCSISNVFVAYNLRFHPIIQCLFEELKGKKIYSVQAYVGQYLPDWRPNRDYTLSYSAKSKGGGGVLRDLSHELDYLHYLFGEWKSVSSLGGQLSNLNIQADDVISVLYETEKAPIISLQMNYLDRITQRTLIINAEDTTYKADFVKGSLQVNEMEHCYNNIARDYTYLQQHTAILKEDYTHLCTYDEGVRIVNLIEKIELAYKERTWIINE